MGRILLAIGFWTLAVWLASSPYALGVAIPIVLLLGLVGFKFVALGMSVKIFLIGLGAFWTLLFFATVVEGARLFLREQADQACAQWAVSISLVGLALTAVVSIQSASTSLGHNQSSTQGSTAPAAMIAR